MRIDIRRLRRRLNQCNVALAQGQEITLTSKGQPIAKLVALEHSAILDRLIAEGKVLPGNENRHTLKPQLVANGSVTDLIYEMRS
jgi:antitoxin (DNA-binding transcriptional repressor) of toxin-antitoxin stability system